MFERFTDRARQVVVLAQDEARALRHNYIGTEHLLLGLLRVEEGGAHEVLESLGVMIEEVRAQVGRIVGQGEEPAAGQIPFTPRAKKVLELSLREAIQLGHNYIGTEHILLGLIREGEGVAAQVLTRLGADLNRTRQQVIQLLHGPQGAETVAEYNRPLRRPGGPGGLDAIRDRLDTIAGQLAAIVSRLGIGGEAASTAPAPRPAALRQLDERIARIGREKQAAIDAQDFERAVTLRDEEQELLRQRDDENSRWMAAAGERPSETDGAELDRLRRVIDNLQAQLRRHGIEPDPEGSGEADPPADATGS